jgi:hypothetical protein
MRDGGEEGRKVSVERDLAGRVENTSLLPRIRGRAITLQKQKTMHL